MPTPPLPSSPLPSLLTRYATEVDVDFVRRAVRAIGRCAIKVSVSGLVCGPTTSVAAPSIALGDSLPFCDATSSPLALPSPRTKPRGV